MADANDRSIQVMGGDGHDGQLLQTAEGIILRGQDMARRAINSAMVYTYFELGRAIVEDEQRGDTRAQYGKRVLKELSAALTQRFGRGFSEDNLSNMRKFYLVYSQDEISETASRKLSDGRTMPQTSTGRSFYLSWSHYVFLMQIRDEDERHFYEIEAARSGWSLKELRRQFGSSLYERLVLSRNIKDVRRLAEEGQVIENPTDAIKDPYVLEFLDLKEYASYTERELESRIIDHLQEFLLELGRGFAFMGRQVRFTYDEEHFFVDLVFYNRLLRCFVLFDLKLDKLTHQDIGQMQMYVHYYDRVVKMDDENPTIGILLCAEKNDAMVEMTLPEDNDQIFASRYETVLPSKDELKRLLEEACDE